MHISLFFVIVTLLLSACAPAYRNVPHFGQTNSSAKAESLKEPYEFSYRSFPENLIINELPWEETEKYLVFDAKTSCLEFTYYRSKLPGKKKTVILLPIYSRKKLHELLPLFLASYLTVWNPNADFNLIFIKGEASHDPFDLDLLTEVDSEQKIIDWIKESAKRFREIVGCLRAVLDWAESQDSIDIKRVGIVGFSTSASIAIVAAGVDRRIAATVFFAGGVNFHHILAQATEPRIKRIRKIMRKNKDFWENFLKTAASIYEPLEPLSHATKLNPAKTLYFDAEFDEYISKPIREEFWHVSGKPERVIFYSGHRESFLSLTPLGFYWADRKIIDFLRKKL